MPEKIMLSDNTDYIAVNERFPHIGEKLRAYWGTEELPKYMDGLFQDTRDGQRRGFPFDTLMSLQSLADVHRRAYPEFEPKGDEIWIMSNPHLR